MEYPEYPIDNRIIFKAEVPKDRILKFKGHLHSQLSYYSDNSVKHPAKMDIRLTRWILQRFTREGETVLDPMSGIGSTLLEAVNMNRNCIAVEFEKKFADWTNENLRLLNRNRAIDKRGSGIVVQGDARNLTDVLNRQVDDIVFSPPHGISIGTRAGGRMSWCTKDQSRKALPVYSTSKDNISNLDYGKDIDTIITSPPFANCEHHRDHGLKDLSGKDMKGRKAWMNKEHTKVSKDNIGNLRLGEIDSIITSPPFVETIAFQDFGFMEDVVARDYGTRVREGKTKGHYASPDAKRRYFEKCEEGKIEDPDNIGNLPKGDIDAIVTSPPFAASPRAGNKDKEAFWKNQETRHGRKFIQSRIILDAMHYSNDPENIGNLPMGEIDTIITSPPHANIDVGKGVRKKRWEKIKDKEGFKGRKEWKSGTPSQYSQDPENLGNLPRGEISAIVTSPPYDGDMESSRHAKSSLAKIKRNVGAYLDFDERESENIGHKKGKSYISEMLKVYWQCYSVLKPGGIAVIVTKNFVRSHKPVRLDMDTLILMENCGFVLADRYFRVLERPSFWIRNYRMQCKKKGISDPTAHYEDVLIFRKRLKY